MIHFIESIRKGPKVCPLNVDQLHKLAAIIASAHDSIQADEPEPDAQVQGNQAAQRPDAVLVGRRSRPADHDQGQDDGQADLAGGGADQLWTRAETGV